MKSGIRLLDWLHELGKLANGLAGVPFSPTRKDKFKRFLCILTKLFSLLGKNLADDTADFGKNSLASRRHLAICREDCFQISICLLWPHAFCTQDPEHALSTAHLVKHATPHPWCICVDPLDFSLTDTFEDTISWRPSLSPPMRQIAGLHEDGMPKFKACCSDVVALERAKSSCVHVLHLGAAHMISSALCRVRHERLCVA